MAEESPKLDPTETARMDAGKELAEKLEAAQRELGATKAALEEIKKAQAGSDTKVAKLLSELEQSGKSKQTAEERIAAIEKKAADAEARAARQEWLNAGYKLASDRGLKHKYVESFTGDLEALAAYLDEVKSDFESVRQAEANKILAQNGHKPGSGNPAPGQPDWKNMTTEERTKAAIAEAEQRMGGGAT